MRKTSLPGFYQSVSKVYNLLQKKREEETGSLHWLLQEPVLHGTKLEGPAWGGTALSRRLEEAGVLTLGQVVELAGPRLEETQRLVAKLSIRSARLTEQLLQH